jgi:hypothetical protein
MRVKHGPGWWLGALAIWFGVAGAGIGILTSHSRTPGRGGSPSASWPVGLSIRHTPGVATLLVFLHPECPCSRASVAELGRVLAKNGRPVQVMACVAHWKGSVGGSLWDAVERIPGVKVIADVEGQIAKRFGAETSGTAALYNESGRLIFFGGITGARGHEGDNAGEDALQHLLLGQPSSYTRPNVYGCSIH